MHTTNHYFWMGTNHTVCEDYAMSGTMDIPGDDPISYAIVCDGCSSSKNTDFGSRLLARAAARHLADISSPSSFMFSTSVELDVMLRAVGLRQEAGDSTLLVAAIHGDTVYVRVFGDGVVALLYEDRSVVYDIEYTSGAPFYINYLNNKERMNGYIQTFGNERKVTQVTEGSLDVRPFEDPHYTWIDDTLYSGLKAIVLMSDGVKSFTDPESGGGTYNTRKPVALGDVVKEITSFKNYKGEFVTRRCSRMIKTYSKIDRSNYDDTSVAAIHIQQ